MKEKKKNNNKWLLILQALLLGVIAFLFTYNDILFPVESLYRDKVYQQSRGVNQQIKIIAIDEETMSVYGPFGTWDRSVYADILDKLGEYPSVVAFDLHFSGEMSEEGDRLFLEKAKQNGNVVLASHIDFDTVFSVDENGKVVSNQFYVRAMELPFSGNETETGFVNVSPDTDGKVRRVMPTFTNGETGETYTGFAYKIYQAYCEKKGIKANAPGVDSQGNMWVYYAGKPFDYEAISMSNILNGKTDPRVFTDCIVLVGPYANGLQDQFSVPNSRNQMFGVEINANIVQAYLDGAFPVPADRVFISVLSGLIVFALFLIFSKLGLKWGTPIFILLEIATVFVGILSFSKGDLIIPGIYLLIFIFLDYLFALILKYISVEEKNGFGIQKICCSAGR